MRKVCCNACFLLMLHQICFHFLMINNYPVFYLHGNCSQPRTLQSVPEDVSMTFATSSDPASSQQRVCFSINYIIDLHNEIICTI